MESEWTFTITEQSERFHVLRNGNPVGSVAGYTTRKDALKAIEQIQRWDAITEGKA
jgi:uncharacterized protein YegP (UPF0339 family)